MIQRQSTISWACLRVMVPAFQLVTQGGPEEAIQRAGQVMSAGEEDEVEELDDLEEGLGALVGHARATVRSGLESCRS